MNRSATGMSLVELLVVVLIMGLVSAAAFAVLVNSMNQGNVINNKTETLDKVRNALEKFAREVRMARTIGDDYGNIQNLGYNITDPRSGAVVPASVVSGSKTFPSTNDPLYGNGAPPPPNGWPVWVDGNTYTTFVCDNTTCVFQIPIFDVNGFAIGIPKNWKSAGSTVNVANYTGLQEDMNTYIYKVLADPNSPGQYALQYAVFPGYDPASNNVGPAASQLGPITLVTHIIGPINPATGRPRTFEYLDKTAGVAGSQNTLPAGTPEDTPISNGNGNNGEYCGNYSGIIFNLEVASNSYSNIAANVKPLALKTEVFLRNNTQATPVGGAN